MLKIATGDRCGKNRNRGSVIPRLTENLLDTLAMQKLVLHHRVMIFIENSHLAETKDIIEEFRSLTEHVGVLNIDEDVPDPQEFHHALRIRAYDRNTNHQLVYPQVYIETEHIGDANELNRIKGDPEAWAALVKRVKGHYDPTEPASHIDA